jgi:hypothetical protein
MPRNLLIALALFPALAACSSSGGNKPRTTASKAQPVKPAVVRPPSHRPPQPAQRLALPGLEGVIGATEDGLVRQFGAARLEVWEGDARKLQFTGNPCVLDVYLYPAERGGEPQATYVDARRASDGQDVDRAACIAALRKPRG